MFYLKDYELPSIVYPVADPEIFISRGPLTDLRGGPLQSRFSDSLYKQPFFSQKGGAGPPGPP